jgi:hypothetical protein
MAMFTAYFDASGQPGTAGPKRALYVAGFVSSVQNWKKFEAGWPLLLARHRLPMPFHMADFMARANPHYTGQYKDWQGDELGFRTDVATLIKRHTNKPFAAGVTMEHLARMFAEYDVRSDEPREPFPWCGLHVCRAALIWEGTRRLKRRLRTEMDLVFEDGDQDKGKLKTALWDWYKREITFRSNNDKSFAPFAACDFLAWEFRKWSERREIGYEKLSQADNATTPEEKRRLLISAMKGVHPGPMIPHVMQHLPKDGFMYGTWDSLSRYCERAGYPKRP